MAIQSINPASLINLNLPLVPESDDPKLTAELFKVYNALRNLNIGVMLYTGAIPRDPSEWSYDLPTDTILTQNLNRLYGQATEAIAYGALVNVYDQGAGVRGFRNATATGILKRAHGICNVVGGVALGAYTEILIGNGLCTSVGGLVIGTEYYLSLAAGGLIQNAPPVGVGNIAQHVGYGLGAALLYYSFHEVPKYL
jgi:hypothetical protein